MRAAGSDPMVFGGANGANGTAGDKGEGVGLALRSAFIALDDEILKQAIVRSSLKQPLMFSLLQAGLLTTLPADAGHFCVQTQRVKAAARACVPCATRLWVHGLRRP